MLSLNMSSKNDSEANLTLGANTNQHVTTKKWGWCARRTTLERVLLVISSLCILLCVILAAGLGSHLATGISSSNSLTCDSIECIHAASAILRNMNSSVDPCEDFYEFACGGYEARTTIPDDEAAVNAFKVIQAKIRIKFKEFFNEPISETEPYFFQLVKNAYASCINTDKIQELGAQPLKELLQKVGGWPVIEGSAWTGSRYDWQQIIFAFRKLGVFMNPVIDIAVVQDLRNASRFTLQLEQPSLGMPDRSYLLQGWNTPLIRAYLEFMVTIVEFLGVNRESALPELKEAIEFEMELAKYSIPQEEFRNFSKLYNKMTVSELQILVPQINWIYYLNNLLPNTIDSTEQLIITTPSYFQKFGELISKSDKRVVANYLCWRLVKSLVENLDWRFQDAELEYLSKMTGTENSVSRPYFCVNVILSYFDLAVGGIYIRKYFRQESKLKAELIVHRVRKQFYKNLKNLDWLGNSTLYKAQDKAAAMFETIAYPDELMVDENLNNFYKEVNMNPNDYFGNILEMNKFGTSYFLTRLGSPARRNTWTDVGTAAVVDAFYKFSGNIMVFYAGILHDGAFFHPDRPQFMNFASFGFLVGHELSHGFDDMGRQYDKDGNLRNWWDEDTDLKFQQKAGCIMKQYENYIVPEIQLNVNGKITLGENIADIGGVKHAYKAYDRWVRENGEELSLPGLPYTPRQLFWITYANVWCSKYRRAFMKLEIKTNYHSPNRFRTNGPVSNNPEFSQDFNCPSEKPMNPSKKCMLW